MATTTAPASSAIERAQSRSEGQWAVVFRRFRRHRLAMVSLGILVIIFGASILAPWIAPFPRDDIGLNRTTLPPMTPDPVTGRLHVLGTDHLGRDFFTRVIYAARVSLMVALSVTTLVAITGSLLGLIAGFFGGWVDNAISRVMEFVATIPDLPILLILSSIMIQNADLIVLPVWIIGPVAWIMAVPAREATQVALLILVLASLGWVGVARLMRGMVLQVREMQYIESARSLGGSNVWILAKHVFPNSFPPLIVAFTLGLNGALVSEVAISFLGFGVQDPTPTWGNMMGFATSYMFNHPWMPLIPGLPIFLCSLAFNFIGDGLRDALDPRLKL
ncbi:MAG: ABC transporter permease [Chloroflexi bacterium]|nr:ABC transporter permease [Chloroflexota bacterium]